MAKTSLLTIPDRSVSLSATLCEYPPSNMSQIRALTARLMDEELSMKSIIRNSPDIIMVIDTKGFVMFSNYDAFQDVQNIKEIIHRDDIEKTISNITSCSHDSIRFINRCHVGGKYNYFEWNIRHDGNVIIAVIRNTVQECSACELRTTNKCK